jgi:hypothetical protein
MGFRTVCPSNTPPNTVVDEKKERTTKMVNNVFRLVRGSLWDFPLEQCRSAHRSRNGPVATYAYRGFRTVRGIPVSSTTKEKGIQGMKDVPFGQDAKVVRSGSWNSVSLSLADNRRRSTTNNSCVDLGFRTVRGIPVSSTTKEKGVQGMKDVPSGQDVEVTVISLGERTGDSALREAKLSKVPQSGRKEVLASLVFTRRFSGVSYEEAFSKATMWMNTMAETSGVEVIVRKTK